MNSREQVSNGYDDTSTGDEQIRPVVFLVPGDRGWNHSRESWMSAGGRTGNEEDWGRGRGQHAGDDTEG